MFDLCRRQVNGEEISEYEIVENDVVSVEVQEGRVKFLHNGVYLGITSEFSKQLASDEVYYLTVYMM